MKQKVKVEEVENEGLVSLLEKRVLLMSAGYFYEGILIGVNDDFAKLKDAHLVYETGKWSDSKYTDTQKLHTDEWYIRIPMIESYGVSKNV